MKAQDMLRSLKLLGITTVWGAALVSQAAAQSPPKPDRFLEAVRAFGKTLDRQYARPRVVAPAAPSVEDETKKSDEDAASPAPAPARGMWPVVIKLEPGTDPVPPAGEANLLYEATTLATLRVLAESLDEGSHRLAANGYVTDFLAHAQSTQTGLLAWGPALSVQMTSGKPQPATGLVGEAGHELLPRTTPWEILWDTNPEATTKAIAGLEYHFLRPGGALFAARGPFFEAQRPKTPLAHCDDAGQFVHAFAFLYRKSGERRWLDRARTAGELYWSRRDPTTGLVPEQLAQDDAPQESALEASSRQVLLGYLLLKAWKEVPHEQAWGTAGLAMIKGYDTHAFSAATGTWQARLKVDGSSVPNPPGSVEAIPPAEAGPRIFAAARAPLHLLPLWEDPQPGRVAVPVLGRVAAYSAGVTADRQSLEIARRAMALMQGQKRPRDASVFALAHTLNLSLDLYDLTQEKKHLDYAQRLGDDALANYWNGRLFRTRPGSDTYDARLSTGDLAAGLLRLHLRLRKSATPRLYDWTF